MAYYSLNSGNMQNKILNSYLQKFAVKSIKTFKN